MSSGVFRDKESLNRVELSWLVQDLLNFGVLASLQLWGGSRWVGGVWRHLGAWGCPHTCAHACACTHMYTCIEIAMATNMEASMFIMFNMHVCACMCACVCMCMCVCMEHPSHTHPNPNPNANTHRPQGGTPGISKNSITVELIKIIQFCLKIWNLWKIPHQWVGV